MSETCESTCLATRVADRVREMIRERSLKPGQRVTTEGALAAEMRISRVAVREGIGQLRGLGLVEPSKRNGIVVTQSDPAELLGLAIPQYVVDHATFAELARLRCALELGSVEMAVQGATEADIERLRALAEELTLVAAYDLDKAAVIEIEFHKDILAATRSQLLANMHRVVVGFFRRAPKELPGWYRQKAEGESDHVAIAEAFATRDAEHAHQLLMAHLLPYLAPPTEEAKMV